MFNEYYLLANGEKTGPYTTQELMKMDLEIHAQILAPGTDTWQDASDLPEFFEYFQRAGYHFPTEDNLASFGRRLLAYLIDYVFLSVLMGVIASGYILRIQAVTQKAAPSDADVMVLMQFTFFYFIIYSLYHTLCESTPMRGSIGKKLCKLAVVDADGRRLSVGRALIRNFAKWVSFAAFGIGFLNILWNDRRQAWQDMLAKTYVIKQD
ncbi:hypothetical protein A0256_08590 [Mucilaginibacter sp. PAMC 26640]|nr:hypothetical protein A0256_08590 [Mucilaginibacter sp. PAMC 26640]